MAELLEISGKLWSESASKCLSEEDRLVVLEQYKLCIASAEKISQNRLAANTFFLSFNTAIVGALAGFFEKINNAEFIATFYVAAILMCLVWIILLRSYRNLNSAKFKVIGAIEERLPMSPYWRAEWTALGSGNDYRKYIPLSLVEQTAPVAFLAIYGYLLTLT